MSFKKQLIFGTYCFLIIFISGCGEQTPLFYPVRGVVHLDGKTVPGAIVSFISQTHEGVVATGTTNGYGVFSLSSPLSGKVDSGLPPGEYFVIVEKKEATNLPEGIGNSAPSQKTETKTNITPVQVENFKPEFLYHVPKKYGSPKTSGLTATVKEKNDPMIFHLKTEQPNSEEAAPGKGGIP